MIGTTTKKILQVIDDQGPIDDKSIWLELGKDYEYDTIHLSVLRCKRNALIDIVGKTRRATDIPRYCLTEVGRSVLNGGKMPNPKDLANEIVEEALKSVPNSVFDQKE